MLLVFEIEARLAVLRKCHRDRKNPAICMGDKEVPVLLPLEAWERFTNFVYSHYYSLKVEKGALGSLFDVHG